MINAERLSTTDNHLILIIISLVIVISYLYLKQNNCVQCMISDHKLLCMAYAMSVVRKIKLFLFKNRTCAAVSVI